MKFIYIVEHRELRSSTNCFEFHRSEAFSSLKKAKFSVANSIECNKGFDINNDTSSYLEENYGRVDYSTMGYGRDDTRVEMRLRVIINKVELR